MLDNKTFLNQYECADCKRSADIHYNHSTLKSLFTLHLYTVDGLIAIMYRPSFGWIACKFKLFI